MRWAWLTLLAFVLSVLAGITSVAAPVGSAAAAASIDVGTPDRDDGDQLVADDGDDDDDDELDEAALAVLPSPTRVPLPLGALVAPPLIAPQPRLAVDDLFRPPRFSSV